MIKDKLAEISIGEAERLFLENGDSAAFDTIVLHYMEGLISYVCRTCCDFSIAEDISQDCFAELWEKRKRFAKKSSLKTYLYAMGHNMAVNAVKACAKTISAEDMEHYNNAELRDTVPEGVIKSEQDKAVREALRDLPSPKREIIYLHYFEQFNYADISTVLKLPIKKVYKHAEYAKQLLAQRLSEI